MGCHGKDLLLHGVSIDRNARGYGGFFSDTSAHQLALGFASDEVTSLDPGTDYTVRAAWFPT